MIGAIGVVVPAHDEHDYLAACLAHLAEAARHPMLHGVRVQVVVVADACTDDTATIALGAGAQVLELDVRNVGAARARGTARAIDVLTGEGFRHDEIWLAHTDADTLVPVDWLAKQSAYATEGWSCVLGAVHVDDWSPRPAAPRSSCAWPAGFPNIGACTGRISASARTRTGWPGVSRRSPSARIRPLPMLCANSAAR